MKSSAAKNEPEAVSSSYFHMDKQFELINHRPTKEDSNILAFVKSRGKIDASSSVNQSLASMTK